eukprot:UN06075
MWNCYVFCVLFGDYSEASLSDGSVYAWLVLIITISQSWALYCLVLFYHGLSHMEEDTIGGQKFRKLKPLQKFVCIKAVVFLFGGRV